MTHEPLAVLLIAHGSRNAEANADLLYMADQLRGEGIYAIVEGAFLELAEPTIPDAAERCVQQGARRVILLPYFLSAGVHVQRDLAEYRRQFETAHPGVRFDVGSPLSRHPLMAEIVKQRAAEAAAE